MTMQQLLSTDLGIICCPILNRINVLNTVVRSLGIKKNAEQESDSDEAIPVDSKYEL
jgi:hypothetical protein